MEQKLDGGSPRERLVREALESYKDEYQEMSSDWRSLDGKAQGSIAISGIVLTAIFIFLRTLNNNAGCIEKSLLTAVVVMVSVSIILALLALRVRIYQQPPLGEKLETHISNLLASGSKDAMHEFYVDQSARWKEVNANIVKVNDDKASRVQGSQYSIALAIFLVAIIAVIRIWCWAQETTPVSSSDLVGLHASSTNDVRISAACPKPVLAICSPNCCQAGMGSGNLDQDDCKEPEPDILDHDAS